jgi:Domain of unknown function (DUF4878)
MNDSKHRAELAELVERRRRELSARPDISQTMRKLSQSSSRNSLAPHPEKRSTFRVLVATGVAAAVLFACVLGTVAVVWANSLVQSSFSDPENTVQQFYSALHETNYQEAYSYFSANARANLNQPTFVDIYSSYDRVGGIIQDFPIQSKVVKGNTAQIVVLVTRRGDGETGQLQTLHMVYTNNSWYIDSIIIGETVPLPTVTSSS